MGLLALLLAGLAGWLIWTGRLQRMSAKDGMTWGVALLGAVLAAKGKPAIGVPLIIGGAFLLATQGKRRGKARTAVPRVDPRLAEARALLGVTADADATAIRAAHRRLIASVHPDRGGTEALAAQINAARDLLLADQAAREGGASA